ncbi:MAG TPA: hypothetical protein VLE49_17415 [Anaerolineales bacterium]|nr:hypothetical protein [Anaerolineales bacterium]
MMIDLTHISSWIWILGSVVIVILLLRFFSHIFHIIIRFFWHGCATAFVLLAAYFILRSLHIL